MHSQNKSIVAQNGKNNIAILFSDSEDKETIDNINNMQSVFVAMNYNIRVAMNAGSESLREVINNAINEIDPRTGTLILYIEATQSSENKIFLRPVSNPNGETAAAVGVHDIFKLIHDAVTKKSQSAQAKLRRLVLIIDAPNGELLLQPFAKGIGDIYDEGLGIASAFTEHFPNTFSRHLKKTFDDTHGSEITILDFLNKVTDLVKKHTQNQQIPIFHAYPYENLLYEDFYGENKDSPQNERKLLDVSNEQRTRRASGCLLLEEVELLTAYFKTDTAYIKARTEYRIKETQESKEMMQNIKWPMTEDQFHKLNDRWDRFGMCK